MNTRILMTISAFIMGVAGIILSFLPHEILTYLNSSAGGILDGLILQLLGALYFAFAMVNWTARSNLIGGIYARPVAVGNLTHFAIGALALIKGYSSSQEALILSLALIYSLFAVLFAIVIFTHPVKDKG
jgi:hypothetical protein